MVITLDYFNFTNEAAVKFEIKDKNGLKFKTKDLEAQ